MSKIKGVVGDLIKEFGMIFVLKEIAGFCRNSGKEKDRRLGREIEEAIHNYERSK